MKIVAINGTYRKKGTTTKLTQSALEGAAAKGTETEMIFLMDKEIKWCRNCLTCYDDLDSVPFGKCPLDDDVAWLMEKLDQADGVIFASPVHGGLTTGRMVQFLERITFRMCKAGGEIAGLKACPRPRRVDKIRAVTTIASAGGMPGSLRKTCDPTPWLKDAMLIGLNGHWVGDVYADARLTHLPKTDDDWNRLFHLRKLTNQQLREARTLGTKLADTLTEGNLRPTPLLGTVSEVLTRLYLSLTKTYQTVGDDG